MSVLSYFLGSTEFALMVAASSLNTVQNKSHKFKVALETLLSVLLQRQSKNKVLLIRRQIMLLTVIKENA